VTLVVGCDSIRPLFHFPSLICCTLNGMCVPALNKAEYARQ